jgi:hypothetical protein
MIVALANPLVALDFSNHLQVIVSDMALHEARGFSFSQSEMAATPNAQRICIYWCNKAFVDCGISSDGSTAESNGIVRQSAVM